MTSKKITLMEAKKELAYWENYQRRVGMGYVQDYYIDKYSTIIAEIESQFGQEKRKRQFPDKPVIDHMGFLEAEDKMIRRWAKKVRERKASIGEMIAYEVYTGRKVLPEKWW